MFRDCAVPPTPQASEEQAVERRPQPMGISGRTKDNGLPKDTIGALDLGMTALSGPSDVFSLRASILANPPPDYQTAAF